MQSAAKLVVVLGGTGAQGGSVVNHLLKEGAWRVRVPTRDPDSAGAMKLQQRGVEIVKADLDRAEDLAAVFADAWAAFAVTVPTWDPSSGPSELHRGTAIAEAARAAGVQVYIWSSLPDVERLSGGKLKGATQFTHKAGVWEAVQRMGFPVACTLEPAVYYQAWEAFPILFNFTKEADGTVLLSTLNLSATDKVASFDVNDTGLPVLAVLRDPAPFNNKRIGYPSTFNTPVSAYMAGFERVVGKPVRLHVRQPDANVPQLLTEMVEWFKGYPYYGGEEVVDAQSLVEQRFTDWEAWLVKENWKARFA